MWHMKTSVPRSLEISAKRLYDIEDMKMASVSSGKVVLTKAGQRALRVDHATFDARVGAGQRERRQGVTMTIACRNSCR